MTQVIQNGIISVLVLLALAGANAVRAQPTTAPSNLQLSPYAADPDQLWNRLHRALFLRAGRDGRKYIHSNDPLLYPNDGTFLIEGESHQRALAVLDEFLAAPRQQMIDDPIKRMFFQHDLWAAFDYAAWYPDESGHRSSEEPAAIELRKRLAKAIDWLALEKRQIDALPDNYASAVKSQAFATEYDPAHPERPFLPPELFDPSGPWVRLEDGTGKPIAAQHAAGSGGRAMHLVFMRLPGGRDAPLAYLKRLNRDSISQFPAGSMVALLRQPLTIDRFHKVCLTPVTEAVQIRVYRTIPDHPGPDFHDGGIQDVYEFVLDRSKLFAGQPGLPSVGPDEPAEPFEREVDPFLRKPDRPDFNDPMSVNGATITAMRSCTFCHQAQGVYSVESLRRGLMLDPRRQGQIFGTHDPRIDPEIAIINKSRQYNWGLLQGMLESLMN